MKRIVFVALALVLFATGAHAADVVVTLPAPTFTDNLWDMGVKGVLALGAAGTAYLGTLLARFIGEQTANQIRIYMNQVFENIVVTAMGRIRNAQQASVNDSIKNQVIDSAATAIIAKIPDALTYFKIPLDVNSKPLRDKIEAEITKVLIEADPQKTLAAPDPHITGDKQ